MKFWIVDAFTTRPFSGNPAAVCLLPEGPWPSEQWLQAVAAEVNLSETAFVRPASTDPSHDWELRWFTPVTEARLCGHATLATAHVLASDGLAGVVRFRSQAGTLSTDVRPDGSVVMDFPANPPGPAASAGPAGPAAPAAPADPDRGLAGSLGADPVAVHPVGRLDRMLVELADEKTVRGLTPDLAALAALPTRAVIVTAAAERPADGYDFVSRFFAPRVGIPEDPVTGSAHTTLAPFWSGRLGRPALLGLQASARGGLVGTEVTGDRVLLTGHAVTVLTGELRG